MLVGLGAQLGTENRYLAWYILTGFRVNIGRAAGKEVMRVIEV